MSVLGHDVPDDISGLLIVADFDCQAVRRVEEVDLTLQVISAAGLWRLKDEIVLGGIVHCRREQRAHAVAVLRYLLLFLWRSKLSRWLREPSLTESALSILHLASERFARLSLFLRFTLDR